MKAAVDIDLRNVLKAINFGDSVNLSIGGIEFAAARVNATIDGVSNSAAGCLCRRVRATASPDRVRELQATVDGARTSSTFGRTLFKRIFDPKRTFWQILTPPSFPRNGAPASITD